MNKKIAINDIVDAHGNQMVSLGGMTREIGVDDLYGFCKQLKAVLDHIFDKACDARHESFLSTFITRIKVAHFYKMLQDGEKFDPVRLKGNVLVDGRRRLWAHILNDDSEIEYIDVK